MFCPECSAEFREGFDRCNECEVALVHEAPTQDHSLHRHVTVLETSRSEEIAVVKSLLEGAEIPFFTEGEVMNELFPADTMVTVFNPHFAVAFKVPEERAEEAKALLSAEVELDDQEILAAGSPEDSAEDPTP